MLKAKTKFVNFVRPLRIVKPSCNLRLPPHTYQLSINICFSVWFTIQNKLTAKRSKTGIKLLKYYLNMCSVSQVTTYKSAINLAGVSCSESAINIFLTQIRKRFIVDVRPFLCINLIILDTEVLLYRVCTTEGRNIGSPIV